MTRASIILLVLAGLAVPAQARWVKRTVWTWRDEYDVRVVDPPVKFCRTWPKWRGCAR